MSRDFHELKIAAITAETDAAKTIEFEVPASLAPVFAWRAGQHVTLRFVIDGEEVRRSYSVSASPFSGERLRITVKRVEDGFVSRHVHEQLTEGDTIEVMPPFGGFCLDPDDDLRRTHYFFGAGSGITPLFSMLHSVLLKEPHSVVHLLYGNYSEDNIIFKERLAELGETFSERLSVDHVLSGQSLLSMFKAWRNGVINEETVHELIGERPPYAQDTQYYICGPGNMNQTVRRALMAIDVPASRIHSESFGGAGEIDDSQKGIAASVALTLDGVVHDIQIEEGETILAAARRAGLSPPFSCQSGVCGACRAKLKSGEVHMRARMALEDSEIDAGDILPCQSVATSSRLEVEFD